MPLEGIIETDWLPMTFTMNWMFTSPGTVTFKAGEPFCFIMQVKIGNVEAGTPRIVAHQSLKVKLGTRDVFLAADDCYLRQSLAELHLPKLVFDRAQMLDSMLLLRRLQAAGARIFYGHDPEFWKHAPLMIR